MLLDHATWHQVVGTLVIARANVTLHDFLVGRVDFSGYFAHDTRVAALDDTCDEDFVGFLANETRATILRTLSPNE